MEINPNPAQVLTVETGESFFKVARRIQEQSARKIAFDNGEPIELNPDSEYSVMLFETTEVLTSQEFEALAPFLLGGIGQAVAAGVISADRITNLATAFTLPKQPPFPFDFPEGAGVKVFWDGTTTYRYEWVAPPVEEEESQIEE
jgi:hypothetical protein